MFWDYVCSLHYFPVTASLVVAGAGWCSGVSSRWCAAIAAAGILTSCLVFYLEPILVLRAVGGRYHVSTRELLGNVERGAPPVTVYYPTLSEPPREHLPWLPFGDLNYIRGLAAYVNLPAFLLKDMQFTRTSAGADLPPVPLVPTEVGNHSGGNDTSRAGDSSPSASLPSPRPVILFSHGLAGYGRLYSTLLMDLAARGATVVAMTHLDASAAFCRDESGEYGIKLNTALKWEAETREPQLVQRVREARTTLTRISSGELLELAGYSSEDVAQYLARDPKITLVGHSFGGATAIVTALEESQEARKPGQLSVSGAVVYDPWHIPLQRELLLRPIEEGRRTYTTPTLQFHSQAWFIWKESWDFFSQLEEAVRRQRLSATGQDVLRDAGKKWQTAGGDWFTVRKTPGTGHLSFTDMALLSPVVHRKSYMKASPRAALVEWANGTIQFATQQSRPLPKHSPLLDD